MGRARPGHCFQNQFQSHSFTPTSPPSVTPLTPSTSTSQRTPITTATTNTTAPPPPIQPSSDLDDIRYFAGYYFLVWQMSFSAFLLGRTNTLNQIVGCILVATGVAAAVSRLSS
nr:uncharacterized protein LOC108171427 [Malus domestica]